MKMVVYKKGDRVRIVSCPANSDVEGLTGIIINIPAIEVNPILRVRLDSTGDGIRREVDGTAEKFTRE